MKKTNKFSPEVRGLEILCGVLSIRGGNLVTNVTKYEPLTGQDYLCLDDAKMRQALYARLNYGALVATGPTRQLFRYANNVRHGRNYSNAPCLDLQPSSARLFQAHQARVRASQLPRARAAPYQW